MTRRELMRLIDVEMSPGETARIKCHILEHEDSGNLFGAVQLLEKMRSGFDLAQSLAGVERRPNQQLTGRVIVAPHEIGEVLACAGEICADEPALELGERLFERRLLDIVWCHGDRSPVMASRVS
jgi:hypothetical protein